jgi:hypothetical protein
MQADDALPSHGEFSIDQLCDNVSSNPDELEMGGPVAYDCPSVPACSEALENLEKYQHFSAKQCVCTRASCSKPMESEDVYCKCF